MKRVFLFLMTNIAVLVVLSIVLNLLGVDSILAENGVDLNYQSLLVFAAVFGMGGSFISLAISKWIAKRSTGAVVSSDNSTRFRSLLPLLAYPLQAALTIEYQMCLSSWGSKTRASRRIASRPPLSERY